jgi:hypothetical protein
MRNVKPTRVFSSSQLHTMRLTSDIPADEAVAAVYQEKGMAGLGQLMAFLGKRKQRSIDSQNDQSPNKPPFNTFKAHQTHSQWIQSAVADAQLAFEEEPDSDLPATVGHFFAAHRQLPAWANPTMMKEGCAFFRKYVDELMMLLGCYSLPYCYAAADGAQVLYLSQRIQKDTYNRLLETAHFVLEVTRSDAFGPNGNGFLACTKIRLMHATIRFYTLHSGHWNGAWGLPINQEDMAGTNLAMSYVPIRGLRKINLVPDDRESEAYLHLWKVVGYLLGIREELLPENLREAYHLGHLIERRNNRASEAGVALTKSLLDSMVASLPESAPKNLPANQMRFLLGDETANLLGIPAADWTQNLLKAAHIRNLFRI